MSSASTTKNPDDVVITMAIRTPLTKGKKGGMKDTPLDLIVYSLLKEVRERMNMDPALVEDICMGNVREDTLSGPWASTVNAAYRSATAKPPTSSAPRCLPPASLIPLVLRL